MMLRLHLVWDVVTHSIERQHRAGGVPLLHPVRETDTRRLKEDGKRQQENSIMYN